MTIVVLLVVAVFVLAGAALPAVLFWRCRQVDAMRNQRLRESYQDAMADMNAGQSWEWRFEAFRTGPTFTQMVWKVWRPVSSFYEEPPG